MAEFQSPFDDLGNKPQVVTGSMSCAQCYQEVPEGVYFGNTKTLKYVCDQGHENILENYNLE